MEKLRNTNFVELFGIFGIIASLTFVGAQLVLDRNIANGEAFQSRVALNVENLIGQRDNREIVQGRAKRYEANEPAWWSAEVPRYIDENNLTMEDVVRMEIQAAIYIQITDNNLYQYELGLIDEDSWVSMRQGFKGNWLNPVSKARILASDYLRPSMQRLISEITAELNTQ